MPFLKERSRLLMEDKSKSDNDEGLKRLCLYANNNVEDTISVSKGLWAKEQVENINLVYAYPKELWVCVSVLKKILENLS